MLNSQKHGSDRNENLFMSLLHKNSAQQYKVSLLSCSNSTSDAILKDTCEKNTELLNEKSLDDLIGSAKELLHQNNALNCHTWKSSFSNFPDPVTLFEKSLPTCTKCTKADISKEFTDFHSNYCLCEPDAVNFDKYDSSNTSKPFKQNNSSQESKSGDDNKLFKPKFGKHRPKKSIQYTKSLPPTTNLAKEFNMDIDKPKSPNISEDIIVEDEEKAHKSQVAKITFKTARDQLLASNPAARRTLGASRKAQAKFVSPMLGAQEKQEANEPVVTDDRLKHIDPKMIELIESEIIDKGTPIGWDDIAGLASAKAVVQEAVVWPLLRPDLFTGLRRPPTGMLLFGPPGTGKTLIGKCVAAQVNATFFSISASSLTSKWIGDGEKMVRALFAVARCHQPAVIFIDEIDSLLTQRSDGEHEATRRIKTEFLVQLDGAATGEEDRLLIIGATNRPQELDEAARRRLVKRLYIPLPDADARKQIISNLLKNERHELSAVQVSEIAHLTAGYSGADMRSLCAEAAMGPVRDVPLSQIVSIQTDKVRPVNVEDFKTALQRVRPSVSQDDLGQYVKWNKTFGQGF